MNDWRDRVSYHKRCVLDETQRRTLDALMEIIPIDPEGTIYQWLEHGKILGLITKIEYDGLVGIFQNWT